MHMSDNAIANPREIFPVNLKKLMQQKGITQSEIVDKLDVTSSTVSDWCNGNKYPRVDKMQQLADLFGVLMSDLTAVNKPAEVDQDIIEALSILESLPANLREAALVQLRALSTASNKKDN